MLNETTLSDAALNDCDVFDSVAKFIVPLGVGTIWHILDATVGLFIFNRPPRTLCIMLMLMCFCNLLQTHIVRLFLFFLSRSHFLQ